MNLNGKTINPGDLRTAVLLAPRIVTTTGSFQRPAPDTAHQVSAWAKWENVHGSEAWTAGSTGADAPATVLVRYNASIDPTWYISKDAGATWFEVASLDNIQERSEYIELKVKRWRAG